MTNICFKKIAVWAKLLRLHRPTGVFLLFFPCLWGHLWVNQGTIQSKQLGVLFLGSLWARSLGCLYNDFIDKDFDALISRTRNRPLACGAISTASARIGLIILSLMGFLFLPFLNWPSLALGFFSLALALFYPWTKRFFQAPQLVLGLAFNMGIGMAWAISLPISYSVNLSSGLLLYGIGIVWTLEYDTIYAYQDAQEDQKLGLKSLAVWAHDQGKIWLGAGLFLRLILGLCFFYNETFNALTYLLYLAFCLFYAMFYKVQKIHQRHDCWLSFHVTLLWMGLFSMILFLGYLS